VLGHFGTDEKDAMADATERVYEAVRTIITEDADTAMNIYNRKNISEV
jgi:peptidyl-tRNA hydrolase